MNHIYSEHSTTKNMTHSLNRYQLYTFWNDEYKTLDYINETFNDPESVQRWTAQGYADRFTGDMCDMRSAQPSWNQRFVEIFAGMGWHDIGTSYYRMSTGTVLPTHGDLYKKYIELFDLAGREHTIRRAIVFLEDWKPGHYAEIMDKPVVEWRAGTVLEWTYDTPHMAANLGLDYRYTLQITGHVDD
jgi:hypothetical protein